MHPSDKPFPSCEKHDDCQVDGDGTAVLRWMKRNLEDYRDRLTDEINHTALAEGAADHFDHDEWLDDELSVVWDLALLADKPGRAAAFGLASR